MKMVRSDLASSGVSFSLDTESGFRDVVFITGAWGLGENVVQGAVDPDEFYVFKPTLARGKRGGPAPDARRQEGEDGLRRRRACAAPRVNVPTSPEEREPVLPQDEDVLDARRPRRAHRGAHDSGARDTRCRWTSNGPRTAWTGSCTSCRPARRPSLRSAAPGSSRSTRSRASATVRVTGRAVGEKIARRRGARRAQSPRTWTLPARRSAGRRHHHAGLGAGHEARRGHRHQPRRAHLPCGDRRARAGHSGRRRRRERHGELRDGEIVTVSCAEGDAGTASTRAACPSTYARHRHRRACRARARRSC